MLITLSATFYFGISFFSLIISLTTHDPIITFDKGSFYLPGVILGLGALTYTMWVEILDKKPPSKHVERIFNRLVVISLVIIFLLPPLVDRGIERFLVDKGYDVCEGASYQWLFVRTFVYTNSQANCISLTYQKKGKSGFGGSR